VTVIFVPYHLDEHLPDLNVPLPRVSHLRTVTVTMLGGENTWVRLGRLHEAVAQTVERAVRRGEVPTVVSGDCMVPLGTTAGLQRAGVEPSIVWFDAHGDVQTLETTTSGYLGGMPLRLLVGYRPELICARLGMRALPENRVLLVDARDLDPAEAGYLASADIRRAGVHDLSADVLPDGPLLLHLDLDVIRHAELPGLRYPAPGGPTASSVVDAVRRVLATGRVAALTLGCTWQPGHHDTSGFRSDLLSTLIPAG
jgi:arginase